MKDARLKILGDYIISDTIGKGTFSKVKLGINKTTKEKVAIKIIEKGNIKEKDDFERVKREIEILNNIKHSNVIKIYTVIFY
jgi:serine/threonine protein kinase